MLTWIRVHKTPYYQYILERNQYLLLLISLMPENPHLQSHSAPCHKARRCPVCKQSPQSRDLLGHSHPPGEAWGKAREQPWGTASHWRTPGHTDGLHTACFASQKVTGWCKLGFDSTQMWKRITDNECQSNPNVGKGLSTQPLSQPLAGNEQCRQIARQPLLCSLPAA